jgi:RsiW-degrading membrane proteinase PrsW (M82 family)
VNASTRLRADRRRERTPPRSAASLHVAVVAGPDAGRVVAVPGGARLQVGHGRECDIVLHDPKVERQHAALEGHDGTVVVTDLGSGDGTWVDGHRIENPVTLRGGERLWVGDCVLEVVSGDTPEQLSLPEVAEAKGILGRLWASVVNLALLRRSPSDDPPPLAAVEQTISTSLRTAVVGLFLLAGSVTLVYIGHEAGPAVFVMALIMAVLPVPIYVALGLMIDRNEREPLWMLVITFFWGACVATTIAFLLNSIGVAFVQSDLGERAGEIYGASISAPVVEEIAKAIVLLIIYRRFRDEFHGVVDGMVYATMVGLGFAANENILYYAGGLLGAGVPGAIFTFIVRGLMSPFAHPLFTAMTGIGFGVAIRSTKRSVRIVAPVLGLAAAIGLHSLWNTAAILGWGGLAYGLLMVPLFIGMLFFIDHAQWQECHVVGYYLQHDVDHGLLYPGELTVLGNLKLRKLALKRAKAKGGREGRRQRARYHHAATELAFLRDRVTRGIQPWDTRTAEQHAHYEAALQEARVRLGPLLYLPE